MPVAMSFRGALSALMFLAAAAPAMADEVKAPDPLLSDPVTLKNALVAGLGAKADVVEMSLGETYIELVVRDGKRFAKYALQPGGSLGQPETADPDMLVCRRKSELLAKLDFAVAIGAMAQSIDLAAANRYKKPDAIRLGTDVFCGNFGWREIMPGADNDEAFLEIVWPVAGGAAKARKFEGSSFKSVDMKALAAGGAKPQPAITFTGPTQVAGDRRQHDYLRGIEDDLPRFETGLGGPQAFKSLQFDHERLLISVFLPENKKRIASWTMDEHGAMKLDREDDTIFMDCNKPFGAKDIAAVLGRLPQLVVQAPDELPDIGHAHVTDVRIERRFICGAPEVTVVVDGDDDSGTVEYEMNGKRIAASLDSSAQDTDEETAPQPVWIPQRRHSSHKHH